PVPLPCPPDWVDGTLVRLERDQRHIDPGRSRFVSRITPLPGKEFLLLLRAWLLPPLRVKTPLIGGVLTRNDPRVPPRETGVATDAIRRASVLLERASSLPA